MRCTYCDTPRSWKRTATAEVHHADGARECANPWSMEQLDRELHQLAAGFGVDATDVVLSVTGGEPLTQASFLEQWLPTWSGRTLLETSGIYADKLQQLLPCLDLVSLDWKDEAALDAGESLLQRQQCLQFTAAEAQRRNRSLAPEQALQYWVKFVVQQNTESAWLQKQLQQIAELAPGCEVYLQPVTPGSTDVHAPSASTLLAELIQGSRLNLDLRVLPQIHPFLGVL